MISRSSMIVFAALIIPMMAKADTFHVALDQGDDASVGSQEKPWKIIAKATKGIRPGDTVILHDGIYRSDRFHFAPAGPDARTRTVFKAAQGERVLLTRADGGKDWKYSGSVWLLTTPAGAHLPATASVEDFPVLVRLDKEWFNFSEAGPNGEDVRFASNDGKPLAHEVDEWDTTAGTAAIWVRVPAIKGDARQEIKMYWGKPDAKNESSGSAVFSKSNGYLSVWHMNDDLLDVAGGLTMKDQGTTSTAGMIGKARLFVPGKGMNCDKVATYPTGANPHSTELWVNVDKLSDRIFCWGTGEPKSMVQVIAARPPHVLLDCYHGPAGIQGKNRLPLKQWIHVFHTYEKGESRLYINGLLDGLAKSDNSPLAFKSPVQVWMGGWRGYRFAGDIDEARVSNVARSADWVRLQYENQKPMQTLVGPLVQPGSAFSVSEKRISLLEGKSIEVSAKAGGAQRVFWIIHKDGQQTIAAIDRFHFTLNAGRVPQDQSFNLQFKAVYADGVLTFDIPVSVRHDIPDPIFTVKAPAKWDGRQTIEVVPQVTNHKAMQAKGTGDLQYRWTISGMAVIKETSDSPRPKGEGPGVRVEKLILKRANNSGTLTVTVTISNGGQPVGQTIQIAVKEPAKDVWVERTPEKDEKPVDNQFYARDDNNEGTLHYKGTLREPTEAVFLQLYAHGKLVRTENQKPRPDNSYAFAVKLKSGLVRYKVVLSIKTGEIDKVLHTADNLVCGDAYIIEGQSNAVAYNYHNQKQPDLVDFTSDWIRTYGSNGEAGEDTTNGGWGNAVLTNKKVNNRGGVHFIGVWGMVLAKKLVEEEKIPICIFNGAVGGTRVDQHFPDPADHLNTTNRNHFIYRNLLRRVTAAKLPHGIRGVLWHQGEADQGYDGPDNCFGSETYQQYFVDLTAAWKQDYPNLRNYYVFQIWPNACSQGGNGYSDKLRDIQRRLSRLYSNLTVMPTLAFPSGEYCHFKLEDYERMGLSFVPVLQRDVHGKVFNKPITAPDLQRTYYTSGKKDEIALEFDQPMEWNNSLPKALYLDGKEKQIASGSANGNVITLKLAAPTEATTITYLNDRKWDRKTILFGRNGIAALAFCEVPIAVAKEKSQ